MIRRALGGAAAAALLLAVAATGAAAVSEEEAVEAYVAAHAGVRKARADLEAARIEHEQVTRVAFAPALAISGNLGSGESARSDGGSSAGQSSTANGGLTLTWSPAVPLSIKAGLQHGSGLPAAPGDGARASGDAATVASLEASLALWPPPSMQNRSLEAESARLGLQQAEHALVTATEEARLEGRQLYTRLQVAAARLSLARQRLSLSQRALARAIEQRQAGLLGEESVLQARSAAQQAALTVQQAAASLSGLERQLRLSASQVEPLPQGDELAALARRASEQALGLLASSGGELGLPRLTASPAEGDGVVTALPALPESVRQAAVERAFEVRHARQQLELARRRLEAVRQGRGTAALSASASARTPSAGKDGAASTSWSVSLSAGLDLFDGGKRRLDEAKAASALAEAERAVEDAREQVRQEVEVRWQEVATATLELLAARAQLDVAEVQLQSARSRHQRGVASADSVVEAELGRADAALSLLDAARSLEVAWQRLLLRVQPADAPLS